MNHVCYVYMICVLKLSCHACSYSLDNNTCMFSSCLSSCVSGMLQPNSSNYHDHMFGVVPVWEYLVFCLRVWSCCFPCLSMIFPWKPPLMGNFRQDILWPRVRSFAETCAPGIADSWGGGRDPAWTWIPVIVGSIFLGKTLQEVLFLVQNLGLSCKLVDRFFH